MDIATKLVTYMYIHAHCIQDNIKQLRQILACYIIQHPQKYESWLQRGNCLKVIFFRQHSKFIKFTFHLTKTIHFLKSMCNTDVRYECLRSATFTKSTTEKVPDAEKRKGNVTLCGKTNLIPHLFKVEILFYSARKYFFC